MTGLKMSDTRQSSSISRVC